MGTRTPSGEGHPTECAYVFCTTLCIWSVQREVVRTGCCRSEAVRFSFIQQILVAVPSSISPLLILHSRCAESTHVLLQFADQNLLVARVCFKLDSTTLPRQNPIEYSELTQVLFVTSEATDDIDKKALAAVSMAAWVPRERSFPSRWCVSSAV